MSDWANWFLLAGTLVIGELVTGTFYLLMLALGCVAGGISALLKFHLAWQLIIGAIISAATIYILWYGKLIKRTYTSSIRDPNINFDIGQSVRVNSWCDQDNKYTARIKYRGAMWDVELISGDVAQSGVFIIKEIRGSCLIVKHH